MTGWATAHVYQDNRQTFTMGAFPLQTVRQQTIRQAERQQHQMASLPARRGSIFGRNGMMLANACAAPVLAGALWPSPSRWAALACGAAVE